MEYPEQAELLQEVMAIELVTRENPCGMDRGLLKNLSNVLHAFIGKYCIEGGSKEQVARYFHRDVRTITRWQQQYPDFPQPQHHGHHDVTYNWLEIAKWKLAHKDVLT